MVSTMPTAYIKKTAKEHGIPVKEAERLWEKAKKQAKEQGHEDDYDYIVAIYKSMIKNKGKKKEPKK